ncbi:MAG: tetratricopeptide repeat protein, partial [Verrucomicrobiaceae bacterium]|nr:tetratricopeptide repeat protein [Verrucomicrobiaceae bacterium]
MPALQGLPLWDDHWLISDNPFIRSPLLFAESFRHYLFLDGFSSHYRPVQNVSYALDYLLWNRDPYGYHLTNVVLHVASGTLLYFLLCRLLVPFTKSCTQTTTSLIAFLIALLWTVHPVHSAAIDYISGRADSLAFLFACAAWLLHLRARGQVAPVSRALLHFACGLCALLALCSREIALIWLCLFLLYTFCFESQLARKTKLISSGCCLLLVGSYAGLRQLPQRPLPAAEQPGNPAAVRAVLMFRALGDYSRLLVAPTRLCMERTVQDSANYRSRASWRRSASKEYLSILGLLFAAGLVAGASYRGRGRSLRVFGALWFTVGFLPVSNIVELNANVAEHWLYLPSVGFLLFVAGAAIELPARGQKISVALASVAVCAFSVRAYSRSTDWVTPKTFFERTMLAGGSSARPAVNLALILAQEGDYAKAEGIFRRVLAMFPDYPVARNGLASVLYRQGKRTEGEAIFDASRVAAADTARHEHPNTWVAALNLARIRHEAGETDAALALLEKARADYPHIWELVSMYAELVRTTRGPQAALRSVAEFTRDHWWHHAAALSLGRLLLEKGDVEGAAEALHAASWLDVHDVEALNLISWI